MARNFTPGDVAKVLDELVTELAHRGAGTVHVIGGAALALINPDRQTTTDIDGWITGVTDADHVITQVQHRWGLDADWFNFHANGLLPPVGGPEMYRLMAQVGDVRLYVARPAALLAMKLHAARAKDQDDIAFLLRHCAVSTTDEAEGAYDTYYPGEGLSGRAIARVQAALTDTRNPEG